MKKFIIIAVSLLVASCSTTISTAVMNNSKNMDPITFNKVIENFPVGDSFEPYREELEKFNLEQGMFYIDLTLKKDDYESYPYEGFRPHTASVFYKRKSSRSYEAQNAYGAKFQVDEIHVHSDKVKFDRDFTIIADNKEAKNLVNKKVRVYFNLTIAGTTSPSSLEAYKKDYFCNTRSTPTSSHPMKIINDGCTIHAEVQSVTMDGLSINFKS